MKVAVAVVVPAMMLLAGCATRCGKERLPADMPAEDRIRWAAAMTEPRTFMGADGGTLKYRYHEPSSVVAGEKYPLVVFLHGAGERGDDNRRQLVHGVPQILNYSERKGEPCFLIAGQVPREAVAGDSQGLKWVDAPWDKTVHRMPKEPSRPMSLLIELLAKMRENPAVDTNRIYVTGISMGGYGTWDLAMRRPDWFAAAMPICGGADETEAARLRNLPVWIFHGGSDTTVPTVRSRNMYAALKKVGCPVSYVEYPGVGHNSWARTYDDDEVLNWLFAQRKR